jgi:hypothetical protein
MERKEAVYKGLEFIPVFYEDQSLTSPDYFQISEFPLRLTAGKNLFKLRGHPSNLTTGGVLGIEVLDYNGDPIYTEVLDYIDEDKSRVIAIYIYEDTSPGDCTITLLAEASVIEGNPAPAEWQNKANVRWTRTVPVNPMVANVSEIIFEKLPTVSVKEQVGVQLDRSYTNGQFPTYNTGTVKLYTLNGQPAIELTGGEFESDMKTGTITVSSPVNPSPTPPYPVVTSPYVSTIKKILTPTTALLDQEYTVYSSQSIFPHVYNEFDNSAFSLSYEAEPIYTPTENSESFALIEIEDLNPSTGDVSRVKVYTNSNGTIGTYELVNDVELEETEILVIDTASSFPDQSIGTFVTQSTIDTYWEAHTYLANIESTAPTLTWTTESMDRAVLIDSSTDITENNHVLTFQAKNAYQGLFIATSSYKVTVDAIGTRSTVSSNLDPVLGIYMSGSAFDFDSTDLFNQDLPKKLGKRIGELRATGNSQRFDDEIFSFESDSRGNGVIIFVVESGVWQIADVRTTTDNEAGYTPNYTRLKTFIETKHKIDNQITFKVEYYNVDSVASKQISYVYNKNWEGGNRYVDGNYSMLTGSLYVADSLNSGVAITGDSSTGFVRSLGYQGFDSGFPGFLLWSGSALAGQTSKGNPYSGVGLELYANTSSYFRYSTSDNEIEVITDKFFFGNPSSSFISGSNGIIEISASNFHLTPEGNVTASNAKLSGDLTAEVGRFDNVEVAGIVAQETGSLYLLETWVTSSGVINNVYQYNTKIDIGDVVTKGKNNYGTLSWTAGSGSGASVGAVPFIGTTISASLYKIANAPADTQLSNPPIFKRWVQIKGNDTGSIQSVPNPVPTDYPQEYNGQSASIENICFALPPVNGGETNSYWLRSEPITLPTETMSTGSVEGFTLQTAVRFGESWGGSEAVFKVSILDESNGVLLEQESFSNNAGIWQNINVPITPALVNALGAVSFEVTPKFKIKLEWYFNSLGSGTSVAMIRIAELRIIRSARAESLYARSIQFNDSALTSAPAGTYHHGDFKPGEDDTYDLGGIAGSTGVNSRWDDVYATNGTIQTSEQSKKENITDTDLGLEFINTLHPVMYRWIGKNRTHYGLIAQEVSESLNTLGKTTTDFGGITTGSMMGLRYNQLLSPMIKAIQELSREVQLLKSASAP